MTDPASLCIIASSIRCLLFSELRGISKVRRDLSNLEGTTATSHTHARESMKSSDQVPSGTWMRSSSGTVYAGIEEKGTPQHPASIGDVYSKGASPALQPSNSLNLLHRSSLNTLRLPRATLGKAAIGSSGADAQRHRPNPLSSGPMFGSSAMRHRLSRKTALNVTSCDVQKCDVRCRVQWAPPPCSGP